MPWGLSVPSKRIRNFPKLSAGWCLALTFAVAAVGVALPLGLMVLSYLLGVQASQDQAGAAPTICTFSRSEVLAESILGNQATARLQQLASQVQAQLASDRTALAADINAVNEEATETGEDDRQSSREALQRRQSELQGKTSRLNTRIRYTRAQVTQKINKQINELVDATYGNHGCSILLKRDVVLHAIPHNDLTPDVLEALNNQSTTITFDLLSLPKPSANDQ